MSDIVRCSKASNMADSQLHPARLPTRKLAIHTPDERKCADAQPVFDSESIERFCRVWAEAGRAILLRRNQRK
jgi:hypothetical protein